MLPIAVVVVWTVEIGVMVVVGVIVLVTVTVRPTLPSSNSVRY